MRPYPREKCAQLACLHFGDSKLQIATLYVGDCRYCAASTNCGRYLGHRPMKPIAVVLRLSVAGLALWSGLRTHQSLSDDAARAIIDMRTTQCVKDAEARWDDRAEHMVAYDEASALSLAWDASENLAKEQREDRAPIIEQIVEWFSPHDNSPA